MTVKVTKKKLDAALETYAGLVEAYPDNEDYLQRYADMLQSLGREATATITLQRLHDLIAARSPKDAIVFAKKHPQIGRISLDEIFDGQDNHIITGKIIYELLGKVWLKLHQKKLKEGQAVCRTDDLSESLFLVIKGNIGIYATNPQNYRVLLENVGIYDIFGEHTFLNPSTLNFDAFVSSESAIVVQVPRKKVLAMIANNEHLNKMLRDRAKFRYQLRRIALHPIFKTLPLKLSKYLARQVKFLTFAEKTMVLNLEQHADGIDMILSGRPCYLAKNKEGKKFALAPLKLGSLIGDLLLQGKKSLQKNELYASTQVQTMHIPFEQLFNISNAFPPLKERLLLHAEQQQQQIIQSLADL